MSQQGLGSHQGEITRPTSGRRPLYTHNGILLQHCALQVALFPEFGSNQQSYLQQGDTTPPPQVKPQLYPPTPAPTHLGFQLSGNINPTPATPLHTSPCTLLPSGGDVLK